MVFREVLDSFQDFYMLRKKGALDDDLWATLTGIGPRLYAKVPAFETAFRFAEKAGWLHPEFAAAYSPLFSGGVFLDPMGRHPVNTATPS